MSNPMGILFNIQRFSLHDGPGIRTTVFFKGCNMRCAWCHNPESFQIKPQLSINHSLCTLCGKCLTACKNHAHTIQNQYHSFSQSACTSCFQCIESCPNDALSVIGQEWTVEDVVAECLKDEIYYKQDGGVTFSGGEASLQYDFLLELAKKLKENHIHTCLETNGAIAKEKLVTLSKYIDLFLFDFKLYDDDLHKKYIGVSNKMVYESLAILNELQKNVILRCPIIPQINDCPEHFEEINRLKHNYNNIIDVEIMAYHNLGQSKWNGIGLDYTLKDTPVPDSSLKKKWELLITK
ncbi:glycyl-radical enzyme activating protein [Paludicola sp. MB14-C6]|uniref:glycyl-radical enzyme activating protein n=1 Tax=Paludihabitans sp. MB14-C6 TaxID=3070656 RepID=UPI0027DB4856|nr:glycyl-radical enzyme activating protein [Paludicola sp. MB14-C6]WMJ22571.1 glycyl-radical enzyme activating protein [Paludicola sp. MB14-C6]